jgi:paraquat-inducible protein A
VSCPACSLVQVVGPLPRRHVARCARCSGVVPHGAPRDTTPCLLLALGAAALFVPAHLQPVLSTRIYGSVNMHTVIGSALDLAEAGSTFVALLLLFGGVVAPAFEILGLVYLCAVPPVPRRDRARALVHRTIALGMPWNFLVVFIAAMFISAGILRLIFHVSYESGLFYYGAMLLLIVAARLAFDPRRIWASQGVLA